VGEPLGVLNGSGLISVARTTGGTDGEDTFTDVVNIFTRLLPGSYGTAVWLAAPAVVPHLLQMTMSTSGGGVPSWLTGGQLIQGAPLTLLGRPLIITEKVPNLASAGDLALVDFSHYLIGDRQMVQATSSPHYKFASDVTAYKVLERVDGRPWVNTPLTPKNNGPTLSPYVTRAA
jgi:HK97 family phage major capsid protein